MSFVVHRVAKSAARYTDAGGREKCGYCRFFMAPRACGKVIGPVSPQGWCKYFSRQAVSLSGGGLAASAGGASFDQNFLTGSLGTGAVFTRVSTGTYYDSAGVLQSAAINTPRFDYDPVTLQLKGLLLEDASTNIALWSGDISNAVWLKVSGGGPTVPVATANQTTAPDGTLTAASIVYPAVSVASSFASVYQAVPTTAVNYIFSVYLRGAVGGEQLYIGYFNQTEVRLTLTTQWQRFSVIRTGGASSSSFMIGADLRGAGNTSTPAQTIYAWGAQVEVLPYMSSHIPTTSVSVTRARDVLYYPIPSAVSGYNPTTYSLFVEFDSAITTSSRGGISDGVFGNSTYFVNNGFVSAQTGGGSANGAVMTAGPINKQCGTYSATQLKCCNNGAIVGSVAATVAGQPTATRLSVGCSPWALDNQLNGHMRRVSYWPRVLSDSEMQAVTTLAGPTLSLDFMQPGTLDPRITFTRASSATYTDASGVIQTAVTNAPRWDYAGGVLRGVLIEEARTNLILQSQDVNQAVWTKSGTITVTGTVAAPDGTTTAQTFSIAASGVSATYQIVTVASATRAEPSFWIKPVTTTGIFSVENPANNANGNWSVNVALLNPAIWQRVTRNHPAVTISAEFTGTAGNQCGVFIRTGGPVINASWWGFSCEIGAFPTSYIPTTSVSVTRAADVATMPVNATTWYAPYPTPNTLAFEAFQVQNNSKAAVMTGLINASSQRTGNNVSGGNTLTMFDNVAGMNFSVQAVPVGSPYKMAFRFGPGAQGACVNGGAITTQANAALTSGMTTLLLGCDGFGSQANAYLRRVNYWNRALSDTEMQQVTT